MRIDRDTFDEILTTLLRNRSRSLLTAFGIFWGIFMLLSLIGGGQGWQGLMLQNFDGFATNAGFIIARPTSQPYKGFRKGRSWQLTTDDLSLLRSRVEGIDVVTPAYARWNTRAMHDKHSFTSILKGCHADYIRVESYNLKYGRFINEADVQQMRKVCVLGKRVYEKLFPEGGDPCGKRIQVDGIYYQVVGVNGESSDNMNVQGPASESVMLPLTTLQRAYNLGRYVDLLCYLVKPGYRVSEVQPRVEQVLKEAHFVAPTDRQAILSFDLEQLFNTMDNLFRGTRILFWMVGLGTLLAGAIGVSNIMMVTVKERTSEIGIRRAIGARPIDILGQILTESVVLTLVAGMLGISFSVLVLQGLEAAVASGGSNASFQISFQTAVAVAALLTALGTAAGILPALRAMAVKPIDAIRDE